MSLTKPRSKPSVLLLQSVGLTQPDPQGRAQQSALRCPAAETTTWLRKKDGVTGLLTESPD